MTRLLECIAEYSMWHMDDEVDAGTVASMKEYWAKEAKLAFRLLLAEIQA